MSLFAIGSYTQHSSLDARGDGISIIRWDDRSDSREVLSSSNNVVNPTYLDWQTAERHLYAVSEVDERKGAAAAFTVSPEGLISFLGQKKGDGQSACHIKIVTTDEASNDGSIYAVSYGEGSLSIYSLINGQVSSASGHLLYDGSGPNQERQATSHAHQVQLSPFKDKLYVCDLGSDKIWMHSISGDRLSSPTADMALQVPSGYGPRHLAFDPQQPVAYILCELKPRLLVAEIDRATGLMNIVQDLPTAADDQMDISAPAAIKVHPSGRSVAVSNRFDDTIAVFTIDRTETQSRSKAAPDLTLADRFPCGGKAPRDIEFNAAGTRLFIANQDSHSITCRHFSPDTGLPTEDWAEALETGSPVCVVMLD